MEKQPDPSAPPIYAEPPPPYPGLPSDQPVGHAAAQSLNQPMPPQAASYQVYGQPVYQQQLPATVVVTGAPRTATTTIVVTSSGLGPSSVSMQCPSCHAQVLTSVTYTAGMLAWIICAVMILFGCWLGCCLIPFCIDGCKNCEHRCPNCKQYLGTYRRM